MDVKTVSVPASVALSSSTALLEDLKSDSQDASTAPSMPSVPSKPAAEPSSLVTLASEIPTSTSSSSTTSALTTKPAYKQIRVRTVGASLWEKAIQKASAPPYEYRPLAIHFNSTIPEIFERICDYLDGLSIFGLYMTGDKTMQSRITNTADDLRFVRNEGLLPFNVNTGRWPTFVKHFTKLRHFKMQYWPVEQFTSHPKAMANLTLISKTLNTLYLDCEFATYDHLKEFTNLESLTLARLMRDSDISRTPAVPAESLPPYLTYLDMAINMSLPAAIPRQLEVATEEQRALVPGLQRLKYLSLRYESSLDISLFAVLNPEIAEIHLPQHKSFRPEWLIDLPKHVAALTLNFTISNGLLDMLFALPTSLVDLCITEAPDLRHSALTVLPKSLTKLSFPATADTNLELLAGSWPLKNLKELTIRGNASGVVINDLPKDMKVLRLDGSIGDTLSLIPPNLVSIRLPNASVTDYFVKIAPRFLTKLKIPSSTSVNPWCLYDLPKTLTTLTMGGLFRNNDVERFPRGLTKLSLIDTNGLTAYCSVNLPRQLKTLRLYKNLCWDSSCVPHLPPHLSVIIFGTNWNAHESKLPALKRDYYTQQKARHERKLKQLMAVASSAPE